MPSTTLSLKEKLLIAAVERTRGDTDVSFTIEDLAVWAWERDRTAWGFARYETKYPDLDKVRKDMGGRGATHRGSCNLAGSNVSIRECID